MIQNTIGGKILPPTSEAYSSQICGCASTRISSVAHAHKNLHDSFEYLPALLIGGKAYPSE